MNNNQQQQQQAYYVWRNMGFSLISLVGRG
jgi:heme exporter protein D